MSSLSHGVPTCAGLGSSLWSHGGHMQIRHMLPTNEVL